jgi:hypothetical protein
MAHARDTERIAAPGGNRLEASPGIEPGCKDLQARPNASANPLILTENHNFSADSLGIKRFSVASKGLSWHLLATDGRSER